MTFSLNVVSVLTNFDLFVLVGFTKVAAQSTPGDVMDMLNELFSLFDNISDFHSIYKVETIGDW